MKIENVIEWNAHLASTKNLLLESNLTFNTTTFQQMTVDGIVFDGNNKTITIDGITDFIGLFKLLNKGTIKNLKIKVINNSTLFSGYDSNFTAAGWVVTFNSSGEIIGCTSDGTLNTYSGGIAGTSFSGSVIDCCYTGTINAINSGGICGTFAGITNNLIIKNCSTTGTITGTASGGIIGSYSATTITNNSATTLTNNRIESDIDRNNNNDIDIQEFNNIVISINSAREVYTSGSKVNRNDIISIAIDADLPLFTVYTSGSKVNIMNCHSKGNIEGLYSGGIVGSFCGMGDESVLLIKNCCSTGELIKDNTGGICGAFCGSDNGLVKIVQCMSTGKITGSDSGGISGPYSALYGKVEIFNCSSKGIISGKGSSGICGPNSGTTGGVVNITNCYSIGTIEGISTGGIIGYSSGEGENSVVNIKCSYSQGNICGQQAGGIGGPYCGFNQGIININECYSLGKINGDYTGGILGNQPGGSDPDSELGRAEIINCYSVGVIKGKFSGGIIGPYGGKTGQIDSLVTRNFKDQKETIKLRFINKTSRNLTISGVIITNCYATGKTVGIKVGGIVGNDYEKASVSNSVSCAPIFAPNGGPPVLNVNNSTKVNHINQKIHKCWDKNIWSTSCDCYFICLCNSYPVLKCFKNCPWNNYTNYLSKPTFNEETYYLNFTYVIAACFTCLYLC
jgi:hypothetical protein